MRTRQPCLVILGPQGVGKGTQAAALADVLDIEHLSTGALLRDAVRARTGLGRAVEQCVTGGDLVPDDVMLEVVRTAIDGLDDRGYILDGFPRTIGQAVELVAVLGRPIDMAIELTVSLDVLLDRLSRRRVCPGCGLSAIAPSPSVPAVACRHGDGIAVRRPDDTPTTVAHRLALYRKHTQPLVAWFQGASHVVTVDGGGTPQEVHERILVAARPCLGAARTPQRVGLLARAHDRALDRVALAVTGGSADQLSIANL